jgi:hypothetical protein
MRTYTIIAIVLASACILALAPWPYAYYQLLRWGMMLGCGYLAIQSYQANDPKYLVWLLGGLAVIYNPIASLALGRELWSLVNVASALFLFYRGWSFWKRV